MPERPLAIIPTYARALGDVEMFERTLRSLRETGADCDVLVVDDGSPELDLVSAIGHACRRHDAELFARDSNLGFSATVNIGLMRCLLQGRDAILVNADIEFGLTRDWLGLMQRQTGADGVTPASVVGALLLYPNGLIQHAGVFFSLLSRRFGHRFNYGPGDLPEAQHAVICPVTGALQFIRHECLAEVGVYDERFKMGFEDVDYCVAGDTPVLTLKGWRSAIELAGHRAEVATIDGQFRGAEWFSAGMQQLYTVTLEDGTKLRATREHRWPVRRRDRGGYEWVTTCELPGRRLIRTEPAIEIGDQRQFRLGVQHGFGFGDGTCNTGRPSAKVVAYSAAPSKQAFVKEWFDAVSVHRNGNVVARRLSGDIKSLPSASIDRDYSLGFIAGLIAADGCMGDGGMRLDNSQPAALWFVAEILKQVGIASVHVTRKADRSTAFGTTKMWWLKIPAQCCRANPWLTLRSDQRPALANRTTRSAKVAMVTKTIVAEVFCCEEPVTQTWVTTGGIVTGNCIRAWLSGRDCVYQPGIRAIHHESFFRGRADTKITRWSRESWQHFAREYAETSFAEFVPNLLGGV